MVIGGMVMVNMAKVLVIERPRVPKIPISLRFVCFMFVCISTMAQASADGRNGRARGLREMPGAGTRFSRVFCLANTVLEEGRRKRQGRKKRRRKQERNWIVFRKSINCPVLS